MTGASPLPTRCVGYEGAHGPYSRLRSGTTGPNAARDPAGGRLAQRFDALRDAAAARGPAGPARRRDRSHPGAVPRESGRRHRHAVERHARRDPAATDRGRQSSDIHRRSLAVGVRLRGLARRINLELLRCLAAATDRGRPARGVARHRRPCHRRASVRLRRSGIHERGFGADAPGAAPAAGLSELRPPRGTGGRDCHRNPDQCGRLLERAAHERILRREQWQRLDCERPPGAAAGGVSARSRTRLRPVLPADGPRLPAQIRAAASAGRSRAPFTGRRISDRAAARRAVQRAAAVFDWPATVS